MNELHHRQSKHGLPGKVLRGDPVRTRSSPPHQPQADPDLLRGHRRVQRGAVPNIEDGERPRVRRRGGREDVTPEVAESLPRDSRGVRVRKRLPRAIQSRLSRVLPPRSPKGLHPGEVGATSGPARASRTPGWRRRTRGTPPHGVPLDEPLKPQGTSGLQVALPKGLKKRCKRTVL